MAKFDEVAEVEFDWSSVSGRGRAKQINPAADIVAKANANRGTTFQVLAESVKDSVYTIGLLRRAAKDAGHSVLVRASEPAKSGTVAIVFSAVDLVTRKKKDTAPAAS